ncbi:hypothetical protein GCM10007388_43440 [Pseudoduganella plicata]|uniref:Uncharacterized protein n=1 Tax=Pseudoduganella plicata TaxID=321984 RepID=A0AA87YBT6_9BURK|nr:hypothetical protein GCM10007388_43440 [Pseudoduganella plicata]
MLMIVSKTFQRKKRFSHTDGRYCNARIELEEKPVSSAYQARIEPVSSAYRARIELVSSAYQARIEPASSPNRAPTKPVSGQLDELLAEIAALEQANERVRRGGQAVGHGLAEF